MFARRALLALPVAAVLALGGCSIDENTFKAVNATCGDLRDAKDLQQTTQDIATALETLGVTQNSQEIEREVRTQLLAACKDASDDKRPYDVVLRAVRRYLMGR